MSEFDSAGVFSDFFCGKFHLWNLLILPMLLLLEKLKTRTMHHAHVQPNQEAVE